SGNLFNPGGDSKAKKAAGDAMDPTSKMKDGLLNAATGGEMGVAKKAAALISGNKKKVAAGGGIVAAIVSLILALFFVLLHLKIDHMVKTLENKYFSPSNSAMQKMNEKIFKQYVKEKVFKDYADCKGGSINKNCKRSAIANGTNPVTNTYRAWTEARIENQLADRGIVIEKRGNNWFIKTPTDSKNGVNLGTGTDDFDKNWDKANRGIIRSQVNDSLDKETRWKKVWLRYRFGRLLEEKYGIKRCMLFCGTRDALADKKDLKIQAAKLYLVQRVVAPRSDILGEVFSCLITETCTPGNGDLKEEPNIDTTERPSGEGESSSKLQKGIRGKLVAKVAEYSDVDKLLATNDKIKEKGLTGYLVEKALQPIFKEGADKAAKYLVPFVGEINMANTIVQNSSNAGPKVKKLIYLANAPSAVQLYLNYRTYADEIHIGKNTDPTEVGSFVDSLGPTKDTKEDPSVGGTGGAENSPLYSAINDTRQSSTSSSMLDVFGTNRAFAASDKRLLDIKSSRDYKCNNGKNVPSGKLVCDEEYLGGGVGFLNSVADFYKTPLGSAIKDIADVWNGLWKGPVTKYITAPISDFTGAIAGEVSDQADNACKLTGGTVPPGYCQLKPQMETAMKKVTETVVQWIIPNPYGTNQSGGRTYNLMAAGANVAGNDSCSQMGCGASTPEAVAKIQNEQLQQEQQSFNTLPMFAKLFNTDTQYSLISRVAISTPFTVSAAQSNFASIMTNPIGKMFDSFGSLFAGRRAFAANTQNTVDVFKIGVVAFDQNSIPDDPEKYWDEHNCGDTSENGPIAKWQKESADAANAVGDSTDGNGVNKDTYMPIHKTSNTCLLIKTATASAGGYYDSSLLSEDDKKHLNGSDAPATTETAGASVDTAHLFEDSSNVSCAQNTKDLGLQDGYHAGTKVRIRICAVSNLVGNGQESAGGFGVSGADGKAVVNSRVSGAVYAMVNAAKQDNVTLESNSTFRTMAHQQDLCAKNTGCRSGDYTKVAKPGNSNHQMGLAIDFSENQQSIKRGDTSWNWLNSNASKFGYKPYANEAWHWSPTGN
ncbi:MAG: M15 family metallopeptidase, partial [bacterium]